jgi:acyl-CoA thioesterase I
MRKTASRTVNYVALGSSTGAGIGARVGGYPDALVRLLAEAGIDARLVNLCETGATTLDVLEDEADRVATLRPGLITLGIGANDVVRGVPEEAFAYNLEQIASRLALARAPVIVANIPDLTLCPIAQNYQPEPYRARIELFNEHIEATCSRHGFLVTDLYEMSQREAPGHPEYFSSDGFHPSAAGYELWARELWPHVQRALSGEEVQAATSLH